jgi:sortase A
MSFFVEPRVYVRRRISLPSALAAAARRLRRAEPWTRSAERALLLAGGLLLAWCGWTLAQAHAWQRYESWSLDRQRRGESASVAGYLASRVGLEREAPPLRRAPRPRADPVPPKGGLVGRLEIPRLGLSAIVLEGDDSRTLKLGIGHIPGTPMPGPSGNVALAAHRDSFFRPLDRIRASDEIELTTPTRVYRYRVKDFEVVPPDDLSVLRDTRTPSLTLVTCYPFRWVGNAPKRFVVHASRIESN